MSKPRLFFAMFSIIAVLMFVNHVLHFVSPLIRMSDESGGITEEGDDLTTWEFLEVATFFENYNWSEYNSEDFPDWLYMPSELPTGFNASNGDSVPPFYGYNWDEYDPTDFPNWLIMPTELPSDFNSTDPEYVMGFITEHIDPEFIESMEDGMSDLAEVEDPSDVLSGENFDLGSIVSSIISVWELVYGVIWLGVAIVLFILSRSVD